MTTKRIKFCQKLSFLAKQSKKFSSSCIHSPTRAMSPKLELNLTFKKNLQKWGVVVKFETSCLSFEFFFNVDFDHGKYLVVRLNQGL